MVAVEIVHGMVSQFLRFLGIIGTDMGRNENSAHSPEQEHVKELSSILYPGTGAGKDLAARLRSSGALRPALASAALSLCSFLSASLYQQVRQNLSERCESSLLCTFAGYLLLLSETPTMRPYQWQIFSLENTTT